MRGFFDGIVNDAASHFPTYDVPLLIGEFTLFGLMDAWTYGLNRFAEQGGINWTMWSYKVRTTNSTGVRRSTSSGTTPSATSSRPPPREIRISAAPSIVPDC